jgi:TPR repeat protein
MALYDAFISYSHAKDKAIASALQSAVQTLGKPWYKRRALRVFRDDTGLSATPHLWGTIEQALGQSRFLILLASPEAAASQWVNKEIVYWLETKSADTLLIAVTDGSLAWDNASNDFVSHDATPLPPGLKGRFAAEPKWVDLTAYRAGADKGDARFTELAADFAAAIHGVPKEDLLSAEVLQQRRALRLAASAAVLLLVLALGATTAGVLAYRAQQTATEQEQIATQQRDRAEKTLATAAKAANDLVFDLAKKFRDQTGMPVSLTRQILDRTRELQQRLTESGESSPQLMRSEAAALDELAGTLMAQGDAKAALAAAERGRALMESLFAMSPDDSLLQLNLNAAYSREGNVLRDMGRRAEALAMYQKATALAEKYAPLDDTNDLQRALALSYSDIAEVLKLDGKREEALAAYEKGLAILQRYQQDKPYWQRPLGQAHQSIGQLYLLNGSWQKSAESFLAAVEASKKVVVWSPTDMSAQSELAGFYEWLGRAQLALGRTDDAVEVEAASVRLGEAVVAADPGNIFRVSNLASHYEFYYHALRQAHRDDQARDILTRLVAIREKTAGADPNNSRWQHNLATAYILVGDNLCGSNACRDGGSEEALISYRKAEAIWRKLTVIDPSNFDWTGDLGATYDRIATLTRNAGRLPEALATVERALTLNEQVVAADPGDVVQKVNLGIANYRLGSILFALERPEEALSYLDEAIRIGKSIEANSTNDKSRGLWHFERALAWLYLGQPPAALEDADAASRLVPDESWYPLWSHLLRMRLGQDDSGEFARTAGNFDRKKWPWPIYAFYLGQSSLEELRAAAAASADTESTRRGRLCDVEFHVGVHQLEKGVEAEARALLQSVAERCPTSDPYYQALRVLASGFLKQLDGSRPPDGKAIAVAQCDRLAASNVDPELPKSLPGVPVSAIKPKLAVLACETALKAEPENRRIMFQLGRAYGAAKNYEKARELYERADALGHALATNNLGALYDEGQGAKPDPAEARRLFEKAARAGVPLAMSNIGYFMYQGRGGPKDYAQAREWYEKASAAGIAVAAYRLGVLYHNGRGVPTDLAEARRWYEKAAEGGNGQAMMEIGFFYERGNGVPVDYAKAREWYEKGAAVGNAPSMGNLGALYTRGWGVPQDYTMARRWYERAAAGGNYIAMFNLGLTYEFGREVPVDYAVARGWYEKSVAQGYASAMFRMGALYEEGHGVTRDLAQAQQWYEKAAAEGHEQAQKKLAELRQAEPKN